MKRVFLFTVLLLSFMAKALLAYNLGLNVYGFSYHFDRTDSAGRKFHEFNPGVGMQLGFLQRNRTSWFADAGIYRNSSAHAAKYIASGYRVRLVAGLHIAAALSLFQSPDNNKGAEFLAPFPIVSYQYKRIAFSMVPLPRYKDVNRNSAIGFYATVFYHTR